MDCQVVQRKNTKKYRETTGQKPVKTSCYTPVKIRVLTASTRIISRAFVKTDGLTEGLEELKCII